MLVFQHLGNEKSEELSKTIFRKTNFIFLLNSNSPEAPTAAVNSTNSRAVENFR